jgi:AcrR family transcriptional regulator
VAQGGLLGHHLTPRALPRGRNGLPARVVQERHRERMLRAMVSAVAETGYGAVTVADVVARARVSRTSFYAQFADKEACLFAATAEGRRLMFERISTAVHELPDGVDDVELLRVGLRAFLGFLADEPAFATVFYLELPAVGRRGGERLAAAQRKLAARTSVWHARARVRHPQWPVQPAEVFLALTGATEQLVREKVRVGAIDELPELEDLVVDLHLRLLTR